MYPKHGMDGILRLLSDMRGEFELAVACCCIPIGRENMETSEFLFRWKKKRCQNWPENRSFPFVSNKKLLLGQRSIHYIMLYLFPRTCKIL